MSDLVHVIFRLQKFRNVTIVPVPTPVAPTDVGGDVTDFDVIIDEDTGFATAVIAASGTLDLTPLFAHINTPTLAYLEVPDKVSLTVNGVVQTNPVGPRWFSQVELSGVNALVIDNDQIPTGETVTVEISIRWYIAGLKT